MNEKVCYINKKSEIPLFGLDFIGIIDRGTNIVELKPITICNLQCRYCFVKAGDYSTNFIVDNNYLIERVKDLIIFKGQRDIEIHIAPYGEILVYKELYNLIKNLWKIEGVERISMQTNGLLLSKSIIDNLEDLNLTRINISLNTLNQKKAEFLADCAHYDMDSLIENINYLLKSNVDVLLAPVWFPGENDKDIEDIIKFVQNKRERGHSEKELQIGIQKYLIYKTGRKLKKIRPKSWGYFYQQLAELEEKYNIKLKLGPKDFGIKDQPLYALNLEEDQIISAKIVSQGRWNNECIGKLNDEFAAKVLLNAPLEFTSNLIGKEINAKVLKSNRKDNLITAFIPF
jgi:hypothetical protein